MCYLTTHMPTEEHSNKNTSVPTKSCTAKHIWQKKQVSRKQLSDVKFGDLD